jgi:transposase
MKPRDFRSLTSQAQEAIRFRAMAALKEGRSKTDVAGIFGVTRQAIHTWVARRNHAGMRALRARRRGRPIGSRLNTRRQRVIGKLIRDHCPDQLKLPFHFWTRKAVGHLITKKYGVRLSVWTVGRLLGRWGFSPQKPLRRAYERNPKAVARWVKEIFPQVNRV